MGSPFSQPVGGFRDHTAGAVAARQVDVEAVRDRLPAAGAASEATLGALKTRADLLLADATFAARVPAALVGGRLDVNVGASALPSGAATEATLAALKTRADLLASEATLAAQLNITLSALRDAITGTATARTLKDLYGLLNGGLPAALVGGRLDVNVGASALPAGAATETTLAKLDARGAFDHGQKTGIGAVAVQLHADMGAEHGVIVKASNANAGTIYLGGSGVTTANGLELGPGESATIPTSNVNLLYAVGSVAGLAVSFFAV